MAATVELSPLDESPIEPCVPVGSRVDAAPALCTVFADEASCAEKYAFNLHGSAKPCAWLDIGCRTSDASLCELVHPTTIEAPVEGSSAASMLIAAASWIVAFIAVLAVLARLFPQHEILVRLGLTSLWDASAPQRRAKSADDDEELERLHDDEEAGNLGGVFSPVAEAAVSAEVAREVEVACAAAHALLDSHAEPSRDLDAELREVAPDPPPAEAPAPAPAPAPALAPPDLLTDVSPGADQAGDAAGRSSGKHVDSPELPPLDGLALRAAFDCGDPLLVSEASTPRGDGDAGPAVAAPAEGEAAAEGEGSDENEDDDFRPSSRPYRSTTKSLAASLD